MELKIDVYYQNEKNKKFELLHLIITEEDIAKLVEQKVNKPLWMGEDWKFDGIVVDKVEL